MHQHDYAQMVCDQLFNRVDMGDTSMTSKWTPGPWAIQVSGGAVEGISGAEPGLWAAIDGPDFDTRHANARLIAAAPDMAAALEMAAQWLEEASKYANDLELLKSSGFPNAAAMLRAALAKAKG